MSTRRFLSSASDIVHFIPKQSATFGAARGGLRDHRRGDLDVPVQRVIRAARRRKTIRIRNSPWCGSVEHWSDSTMLAPRSMPGRSAQRMSRHGRLKACVRYPASWEGGRRLNELVSETSARFSEKAGSSQDGSGTCAGASSGTSSGGATAVVARARGNGPMKVKVCPSCQTPVWNRISRETAPETNHPVRSASLISA